MEKLVLLFISVLCVGCGVIKGHKNIVVDTAIKTMDEIYIEDNILENSAEDMIYNLSGMKTDLSPNSKEDDRFEKEQKESIK